MKIEIQCRVNILNIIHDDPWVQAQQAAVTYDSGKMLPAPYLMLKLKGGGFVMVAARLEDGRFLLVEQCKPAAGYSIEAVAGGRKKGESWERAARRELAEETGYKPGKMVPFNRTGFHTQTDRILGKCHLFLAFDCVPEARRAKLAEDEVQGIKTLKLTPAQVLVKIRQGEVRDASTIACIFFHLWLDKGPGSW